MHDGVLSLAQKFTYRSLSLLMNFFPESAADCSVEVVLDFIPGSGKETCTCPPVHAVGSSNTDLAAAGCLGGAGWTFHLLASFLAAC